MYINPQMRRLSSERIDEMWALFTSLPARADLELGNTFFPIIAGRVVPGAIMACLRDRAGPASDYTSPPQAPFQRPERLADFCIKNGCPVADDCAGQSCYLLQT